MRNFAFLMLTLLLISGVARSAEVVFNGKLTEEQVLFLMKSEESWGKPEYIYRYGKDAGVLSHCSGWSQKISNVKRSSLMVLSIIASDNFQVKGETLETEILTAWRDDRLFMKLEQIFMKGYSSGVSEGRGMKRSSPRRDWNELCDFLVETLVYEQLSKLPDITIIE